jgi:hypothetical protein
MGMRMQQPDQFELARKRAQQEANVAKQTQSDALKRRFAATGMTNSGAAIKQQQLANEAVDKQYAERSEGIDAAQMQENARKQEIADQRNFAREERIGSQQFAGNESALSRALQSKQFDQSFGLQREQFGAQQGQFEKQFGLQRDQFGLQEKMAGNDLQFRRDQAEESKRQFGETFGLAKDQFAQDRQITGLNAAIAAKESGVEWWGFDTPQNASAEVRAADDRIRNGVFRPSIQTGIATGLSDIFEKERQNPNSWLSRLNKTQTFNF